MSLYNIEIFEKSIHPYLLEIADRLWSNHAAVMIGSGFSKNAIKSDYSKNDFPNWAQLGNVFYKKLNNGHLPDGKYYLNVLKLADEVQAAFGRPVLDKLVLENIPDKDHEPSELHVRLLELPWTDVLTTNFDTLLERAAQKVYIQKYDLVVNKRDLIYAEKPRIIKLHGSFPSERPFILTEEDYRRYPKQFAPFVNTVQQSLIENTLCLIGFSADDPNFLQWIGWISDNLGKENSPRIYLVGILDLSDAQKKLLESKNIALVDIRDITENVSHETALSNFIDFLTLEKRKDRFIDWPGKMKHFSSLYDKLNLNEVISQWSNTRTEYPNWLILPKSQRDQLWDYTSNMLITAEQIVSLETPTDIQFLYEFNWRIEKCLQPIFNDYVVAYETILKKYEELLTNSIRFEEQISNVSYILVKQWWLELKLALFRFYREEGFREKWQHLEKEIALFQTDLPAELRAKYYYEKCLFVLFTFKLTQLSAEISLWPINESLPFWEAKRAALLAELGQTNEAVKILEKSLTHIRTRLNLSPVVGDYTLVSQEAYVMQLLQYVKNSLKLKLSLFNINDDQSVFNERWNTLKIYKCDPWSELEIFEILLEREPVIEKNETVVYNFEIGSKSTTHHFGKTGKEAMTGYQFLRYLEECGISPRLPKMTYGKKSLEGALKRITIHSPYWALSLMLRTGNSDLAKYSLNRDLLQSLSQENVNRFLDHYMEIANTILDELNNGEVFKDSGLTTILPEIFSRFVVKCDDQKKEALLDFALKIYHSPNRNYFVGVRHLLTRLLDSADKQFIYDHLLTFLEFPILEVESRGVSEFPDPFALFHIYDNEITKTRLTVNKGIIAGLNSAAKTSDQQRERSISRLGQLYSLKLLNSHQVKSFTKSLWSQIGSNGLPFGTNYLFYSFINLPHPDNEPEKIYKKYLLESEFPIQSKKAEKGISITRGDIPLCNEIISGTKTLHSKYGITWTSTESKLLLEKLAEWWDADKHFLLQKDSHEPFGSVAEEFKKRFEYLVAILSQVISINDFWKRDINDQSVIKRLINEIIDHGLPGLNLKFSFIDLFPEFKVELFIEMENNLASENSKEIADACNVIIDTCVNKTFHEKFSSEFAHVLEALIYQIKWRNLTTLSQSLNVLDFIARNKLGLLTENNLDGLCFGLDKLIWETGVDNQDLSTDDKLVYRKKSAKLAFNLFQYCSFQKTSIPVAILKWEEVCRSNEEFGEIKKQWPKDNISARPTIHA
ncbi:MAG: SIR2-like domain protein [Mucilaginibacter sp.]|nr:SIR2-like domain protein [Mucilaginibacter sp.]